MKQNRLTGILAVFLALILALGSVPAAAIAATLSGDAESGFSVDLPASGSDTLDLTDRAAGFTFKVCDNGGSSGNYTNYCDGKLLITAPAGCLIKISGTGYTESGYDYLYIYDGDSTVPLGSERYNGSFTVGEMISSSPQLTVRFTSDSSSVYPGFELDVTLLDASLLATVVYSYPSSGETRSAAVNKGTEISLPLFADLFTAPAGTTFLGWECGGVTYGEGDSFTLTGDAIFTALTEEPPVVLGNDTDGWYANMPATDTVTADLSDKADGFVLHVYDDGGPDAPYSNSCSGYLRIVAPDRFVLKISGSGRSESTSYDWLTIYDGDTTSVLGNAKYAGRPFTVPELTTTGNVLKLFFRSDSSDTYDGLDLTVTLVDYSNYSHVTYSYDGTEKISQVRNGTEIELAAFTSLFTLPDRYHFTAWQSGGVDYAENESYTVTGDVVFTALVEEDPVIAEDGEGGYYAKLPKTGTLTADLSSWSAGDTLKVYDNGGKDKAYSYSCNGSLRIEAPAGYRLSVNGTYSTYNGYDWIYLYDGDTSAQLGPKFMGYNKTMNDYYTTGSVLIVYLYSYYGDSFSGCDLTVTVVDPADLVTVSFAAGEGSGAMDPIQALPGSRIVLPECGFTLPEKTYFDTYTDGVNTCGAGSVYTVTGNATLTAVYIEKIIATYQLGDRTATAEHRKGTTVGLPYFTEYFTLPYRTEFYRWESGGIEYYEKQSYTFNEDVTFTAELTQLPVLIEKDDGTYYAPLPKNENVSADLTTGYANGLTFKLYDNGNEYGDYSSNCDGSLTFTAPAGYVFLISGSIDSEANFDVLSIYDSDLTTLLGGQSYSGKASIGPLQSSSNAFKVRFATDSNGTYAGFALTVRMIDLSSLITVSFDAGEGSGTMDPLTQIAGVPFKLPDYGFTAPEGKIFCGYSDGVNVYWPVTVTFNESKTLTALWEEATGITYSCNGADQAIRYAKGSTVTLPEVTDLFTLPSGVHFAGWQEKFSGDIYRAGDPYVAGDPTVMTAILEILYDDGNGGYYALMPVNNPGDNLTLDLSDKPNGFSFTLYDDGGESLNYADGNDGVLIVKAPENMVITVSGTGRTENSWDYLRFYDGSSSSSPIIGDNKYSGNISIVEFDPVMTTGNYLRIYFHSDSSYNYEGFALTVTVLAQVTVTYEFDGNTSTLAVQDDSTIYLAYFGNLFGSETKEFLYWQNGDDTYDAGDEYVVTGDVTFTAVTRLKPTATLDGNGATVAASVGGDGVATTLGPIPYDTGSTEPLPHAIIAFDVPDGKYFGGWECGGVIYAPGDEFTITEDVTFTAIWRDATAWELLNDSLQTSGTVALTENVAAAIGSLPLNVPEGVTVTVDLNGYTLDGTLAAALAGNAVVVNGSLTLTDSAHAGAVTGGGVTAFASGVFTPDAGLFAATVTQRYRANDDDYNYENFTYSVSWYPTVADAMTATAATLDYADSLTLPAGWTFRWYLIPTVTLLQDLTVAAGETLEVNNEEGIYLDLNGHTFDVRGTFTGGTVGWRYVNGSLVQAFNPTDVCIDSAVPGVFRSSGVVEVNLSAWTADEFYFTGGTVTGWISADGGTFHISGGSFTETVMFNNGNDDASLEVILSGDAEFYLLEHYIYTDPTYRQISLTIRDNVRINDMEFDIMGDDELNYPVLTVTGGYFGFDPSTLLDEANGNTAVVRILPETEEYAGQADWAADGAVYTRRIVRDPEKDLVVTGRTVIFGATLSARYLFHKQLFDHYLSEGMTVQSLSVTVKGVSNSFSSLIGSDQVVVIDGVEYYWLIVPGISAKDIETPVTLTLACLYQGKTYTDTFTDSLKAALTQVAESRPGTAFANAANAALAYCRAAADHFKKANAITFAAVADYEGYAPIASHTEGSGAIRIFGTSILLKDELAIRFWAEKGSYAGTLDALTVKINGAEVAAEKAVNGNYITFKVPVSLSEADESMTVECFAGGASVSNRYTDSVLDYAMSLSGENAALGRAIINYVYYGNVYLSYGNAGLD